MTKQRFVSTKLRFARIWSLCAVAFATPALISAQPLSFSRADITVNPGTRAVSISDFNGDARPDLAVVSNWGSGGALHIYAGKGDGTFHPPITTVLGPGGAGRAVSIGDLNQDNKQDVVTYDFTNGFMSILLGNGDGTFGPRTTSDCAGNDLLIGQINGDAFPDLAVLNCFGGVSIYLGKGDGTFLAPNLISISGAAGLQKVRISDLNGDGKADVVTTNLNTNNMSVLLGNGDGTFAATVNYPLGTGGFPQALAIGDTNNDGKPDIIVGEASSKDIVIFLGAGNGTFSAAPIVNSPSHVTSVGLADFNVDGKLDIVGVSDDGIVGTSFAVIYLGNGDGTFATGVNIAVDSGPASVAIADLNHDGKSDIVTANWAGAGLTILLNTTPVTTKIGVYRSGGWNLDTNGNGTLDSGDRSFFLGWPGAIQFTGDWNGDGRAKAGIFSDGYWYLDYDGNGVWDNGVKDKVVAWGWPGVTPFVGDWNGDGKTKIAVYSNGFWFLDYNGDFLWQPGGPDKQIGWGWAGVTPLVGDWNGDGKTKIGVYSNGFWFLDYNGNHLWEPDGPDKQVGWGWAGATPVIGDWNGDGKAKIGVYAGGYWYLDYDGNYQWTYPASDRIWEMGWAGTIPVTGDWNGDGKAKAGAFINGFWYLDYDGNGLFQGVATDRIHAFGAAGDTPVVGRW